MEISYFTQIVLPHYAAATNNSAHTQAWLVVLFVNAKKVKSCGASWEKMILVYLKPTVQESEKT